MSFLSGSTKKVSVYGRKAEVRVVNRHSTFTSLENDENDPFGFFKPQTKPKVTYGKSRASVLPLSLGSSGAGSIQDTLGDQSAADQSSAYETADSSSSFHSACSSTAPSSSSSGSSHSAKTKQSSEQRAALASKTLNRAEQSVAKPQKRSSPKKVPVRSAIDATPKARRIKASRDAVESPKTVRKPVPTRSSTPTLPNESTPPPNQPAGRSSRRAAQAARMAIQDYDFTDRDMTPRRPVPTKSYFAEKARQLAELAAQEQHERQQSEAMKERGRIRKSMAARPRQMTAPDTSAASAISISDSSLSSAAGVSDSSFEAAGTSQSSLSMTGLSSDESYASTEKKRGAQAKAKAKQNKRVTRRIAANSDDEDEQDDKPGSDDETEQDPAIQLAAQVADLAVSDGDEAIGNDSSLFGLLACVSQSKPRSFTEVIQQLRSGTGTSRRRIEKIGEASYSEVFKISASSRAEQSKHEAVVLKIIPISSPNSADGENVERDDLPFTSPAADVEREIRLMQLVGSETSASESFVALRAAHIVRGSYPSALLQAWDRWDDKRRAKTGEGAENIRPDVLGRQQAYALLVMTDGGMDLESLKVKSWLQAASIFWQVVGGLGVMESKYEFEHRDLHWGNILVQSVAQDVPTKSHSRGDMSSWLLDPKVSGVKATIIDFTLSRACTLPVATKHKAKKNEVLHYPFDDESLFDGSGDPQFEVYREMRSVTRGSWHSYCPATNVLWLRYLAHKLVDVKCKSHKIPKTSQVDGDVDAQRELRAYTLLQKAVADLDGAAQKLLDDAPGSRKVAAAGRKSLHPKARKSVLPSSATGMTRRGRATMAPAALLEASEEAKALKSAAELMSLLEE
ncbi:Serine/threonine-protein kinase Haspin-like protein [Pseudozyma hubeiensis]|nr:Serine/threonine-protein kinase Haspin-like protein [Pseudozyma hubeiensis]